MKLDALEICKKIGGVIIGDKNTQITSASGIEQTTKESICYINDLKFESFIYSKKMKASILILDSILIRESKNLIFSRRSH